MPPTSERSGVGAIQARRERQARQEHNATTRESEGATAERNACKSRRDRRERGRTDDQTHNRTGSYVSIPPNWKPAEDGLQLQSNVARVEEHTMYM